MSSPSAWNAVVVESTLNWYWLADGLDDAGYAAKLVNTSAAQKGSLHQTLDELAL